MDITTMGWLNFIVGAVVIVAGSTLTLKKDVVRLMAQQKYSEEASNIYAHLAGPLEISFGIGVVTEGLANAQVLPSYLMIPGLAIAGFTVFFAVAFWLFYLKRNAKK